MFLEVTNVNVRLEEMEIHIKLDVSDQPNVKSMAIVLMILFVIAKQVLVLTLVLQQFVDQTLNVPLKVILLLVDANQ
jgi:hypothetical protein